MQASRDHRRNRLADADENSIADYLKERIYATLTGLAIVLVYSDDSVPHEPEDALFSLLIGVVSITAAGYLADVLAHMAVHKSFPTGVIQVKLLRIAFGALGTLIIPGILLALAAAGLMPPRTALLVATIVYLATLAAVGYGAVRRTELSWWMRLLVLAALVLFGGIVIGLQVLAHSG